jgi:hypothetical protein
LFAFPLHRCCHQLALLEIVLIIGVCNGYVKAYWIPNSCRHSFHCVDLVLASLRLPISLSHLDPSSVIIVSPLVSLTSSISASSILAVYFRTTKQTYGQWLAYGKFSHSEIRTQTMAGIRVLEASWFTIDSVSWHFPIRDYPQLLQNCLDSQFITLLSSTSLSLSMPLLTHLILRRIVRDCGKLLCNDYRF